MKHGHRRAIVLRSDDPAVTAEEARAALGHLPDAEVFWADDVASLRAVAGDDFSAVVLSMHARLSLDAIGLAHGLVRGGGCLVLRVPHQPPERSELAAPPYPVTAVGDRTWHRLQRWLDDAPTVEAPVVLAPIIHGGTDEQAQLVAKLETSVSSPRAEHTAEVVMADRGRGKSAALGMLLNRLPGAHLITAHSDAQLVSVRRFCPEAEWVAPLEVPRVDLLVVDEAAGLAVPTLKQLAARARHLVLATTVHGYEGHGRGFSLRFLPWLERERDTLVHRLEAPIRWATDDPLERWIFDGLLLDAAPTPAIGAHPQWTRLDRDVLAGDERMLREVFGLLVTAHYRTTPDDLQRLLDAANLEVHVLQSAAGEVVAACLVAREGQLSFEDLKRLREGRGRLRGQALAETLVRHSGEAEAAQWDLRRNLRTAVHPAHRRRGLGRMLADAVHAAGCDADAFGTLFGATAELLAFRRAQGYRLIRLGATRSDRSGLMSVVMLRPSSPRADALAARLRARLAVDLPHQLVLAGAEHPLPDALVTALREGLGPPEPLEPGLHDALLAGYLDGTHTDWAIAGTLARLAREGDLSALDAADQALFVGRIVDHRSWRDLATARGSTIRPTMRALRAATRHLVAASSRG